MLGATVTRVMGCDEHGRPDEATYDSQVGVQCIAGVITLTLEDGTTLEFDEAQLNGALFFVAHEDAA